MLLAWYDFTFPRIIRNNTIVDVNNDTITVAKATYSMGFLNVGDEKSMAMAMNSVGCL
jgi:uncharacterized protein YlxW (UPF0749 family)